MRKIFILFFIFLLGAQLFAADVIVTKNDQKYHGKVIRITEKGFVVRTVEGSVIVLPKSNIARIYRENKVLDFETGMSYYLEIRRPFLPFLVLGTAAAIYSVKNFQDYGDEKDRIDALTPAELENTEDKSGRYMAWGIVSALFSAGSYYIALKPMEVKVPIGKIRLSTRPQGVQLALHF